MSAKRPFNDTMDVSSDAPQVELSRGPALAAPECVGTCFSRRVSEVPNMSEMIGQHLSFCESSAFSAFLCSSGLEQPHFQTNATLRCNPAHDKFAKAWPHLSSYSSLAIVFHGTAAKNIGGIIVNGLNPDLRRGQAYGPGEYFATEPGHSVSYCKGGLEMLVFMVVVPSDRFDRHCPKDIVVVEKSAHQLPIGIVSFGAVERRVWNESSLKKNQLECLHRIAYMKTKEANDISIKASIIQHLIKQRPDVASEEYNKHTAELSTISKREIAMYARRFLDVDVILFCFPELPEPMTAHERDTAAIRSVDETERDASEAQEKLAKARLQDASP